jgi:hypothetical protein
LPFGNSSFFFKQIYVWHLQSCRDLSVLN